MSSSSTRGSRNNLQLRRIVQARNARNLIPPCECPNFVRSKERMSWTDANPGRRFYNCPYSLSTRRTPYDFFNWKDAALEDPHYKGLIFRMKCELERRETAVGVLTLKDKIEQMEDDMFVLETQILEEKEKHLVEMMKLKTDFEIAKGKMNMAEMVILILGLLVVVLVVMVFK